MTTRSRLVNYFSQFGIIEDSVIMVDRDNSKQLASYSNSDFLRLVSRATRLWLRYVHGLGCRRTSARR